MKKILLPTDFSNNSWNAIKYAVNLFKDETCHFYLLNTYTPIIYQVEYVEVYSGQFGMVEAMEEASNNGLEKIIQRIEKEFKNPKRTVSKISSFNTLTAAIEEISTSKKIDCIVMSTKGATGATEILFGSNTVHTIKNTKRPLLAIPNDYQFETPNEILFPSDYAIDFKKEDVQPLLDIVAMYQSRIHVMNASFGYELSESQQHNKEKLETYFKPFTHIFHSVSNQTVEDAIAKFQSKAHINLLVMINNKHSFFENLFFKSTISHIGFHLKIPFLVIPSQIK